MIFKVNENEALLRRIVKAVEKGIGEDTRDYLISSDNATNNALPFLRSDYINTNLRNSVASDVVELKYFKRSAWTGCLLIDRQHKMTYSICSKQTLEGIPRKKDRRIPHYLQSILYVENSGIREIYQQMTIGDYDPEFVAAFTEDQYRKDYADIMEEELTFDDSYTHVVITYEAEHQNITSIAAKLLTPEFRTAQEYSLMDLLKPDFSELTATAEKTEAKKDSHSLVSVKAGLKNIGKAPEQQSIVVTPKRMEETKQA